MSFSNGRMQCKYAQFGRLLLSFASSLTSVYSPEYSPNTLALDVCYMYVMCIMLCTGHRTCVMVLCMCLGFAIHMYTLYMYDIRPMRANYLFLVCSVLDTYHAENVPTVKAILVAPLGYHVVNCQQHFLRQGRICTSGNALFA